MKRLVEMLTPENGIVLDPFAGSFTTAIACLETGRRYVCIEKESDYFEIGKNRITQWHNDQLNKTGTHELPEDIERIKEETTGQISLF
jgi:DNA modification methylase